MKLFDYFYVYILKELHWLPVQYRIQYKILTHTYKALHEQSPVYIKELLQVYRPRRDLRSQNNPLILEVPRSRTVLYGDRSFAIIAPKLWNALPPGVRICSTLCAFKQSLKTHFFIQTYRKWRLIILEYNWTFYKQGDIVLNVLQ